ncbi:hypothetical protein C2E23DRAFT_279099 [Lenzites betulinus]|nr:hypothetical protein C2E23DRAFT_279099 [Lenzites betulinus]
MLDPPQSVYYIRSEPAAADGEKAQRLVLTTTSLRNVVLANATDVLYYEVVTPRWERHLTRVSRLDVNTRCFDPVAELVNGQPPAHAPEDGAAGGATGNGGGIGCKKDDGAKWVVALRFHGTGELRAVEDFLHTEKAAGAGRDPNELRAWFRSKDGHKYTWRAHKKRLEELQLTRDDDPDKPLVTFHKEKRYMHVLRMSQHPYLEVHPSALESLDYIVVSFLLMERLRREFGLT